MKVRKDMIRRVNLGLRITMPEPVVGDAWQHGGWEGRIVKFRDKRRLVTVLDAEDNAFDIETERVQELLDNEAEQQRRDEKNGLYPHLADDAN
jgi:hypothetical protein